MTISRQFAVHGCLYKSKNISLATRIRGRSDLIYCSEQEIIEMDSPSTMDLALLPTLAFFIVFWIIGAFVLNMRDNGVFDFK